MVNGPDDVYVERGGRIERDRGQVRLRAGAARRDRAHPRAARPPGRRAQPDGRRAARRRLARQRRHPAARGRRARRSRSAASTAARPDPDELVASGTLTAELRDLLAAAVAERRSILISGGTGSGKTTLLNALSAFIGPAERVVTIEDAAELRLRQPHVVRLESRPASVEGRGEVTIRDLLRNALRMRPDRIVIGEVRGAEALDLLTALNTGHDGALSTVHANSPDGRAAPARDPGADGRASACRTRRSASRSGAGSTSSSTSRAVADGRAARGRGRRGRLGAPAGSASGRSGRR